MERIIEGIRQFHRQRAPDTPFIAPELLARQRPDVLFITCADSRLVPSIVMQAGPGRIFMVRNAGNILPPPGIGSSEEGSIEYGVAVLEVRDLVLCGHTHCGAMSGLFDPAVQASHAAVARWLVHAREVVHRIRSAKLGEEQAPFVNVVVQLERVLRYPAVAAAVTAGRLALHGWVHDLRTAHFWRWDADRSDWVDLLDDHSRQVAVDS